MSPAPTGKPVLIAGREPAALAGLLEAALALLLSFHVFGLTAETDASIVAAVAAVFAVYVAYVTRDTVLGALVGLTKALAALAIGFGLELSTEQTALLIAVVTAVVSAWQRTQTGPAPVPSFRDPSSGVYDVTSLPAAAGSTPLTTPDVNGLQALDEGYLSPAAPVTAPPATTPEA